MTPGPTIIRRCSSCKEFIAQHTIASGNTFGARFWTDGKRDAPMLPDQPWLVKCRHCGSLLWIDEQKQVGEINSWGTSHPEEQRFKDARLYETPSVQDYFSFLAKGPFEKPKERYLRMRIWWAGNDGRRDQVDLTPMSSEEVENLLALASLLDEADENDRITKVELMRELGRFEQAEALLAQPFAHEASQAVTIIRELTKQRVAAVSEIRFR